MKNQLIKISLAFLMMLTSINVTASKGSIDIGIFHFVWQNDDKGYSVHINLEKIQNIDVILPSTVVNEGDTFNVTKFCGSTTGSKCDSIRSLTIPNTIKEITCWNFNTWSGLKELIIADGDSTLELKISYNGGPMFRKCPLERVYLGRNLNIYGYSEADTREKVEKYGCPTHFYGNTTLKKNCDPRQSCNKPLGLCIHWMLRFDHHQLVKPDSTRRYYI